MNLARRNESPASRLRCPQDLGLHPRPAVRRHQRSRPGQLTVTSISAVLSPDEGRARHIGAPTVQTERIHAHGHRHYNVTIPRLRLFINYPKRAGRRVDVSSPARYQRRWGVAGIQGAYTRQVGWGASRRARSGCTWPRSPPACRPGRFSTMAKMVLADDQARRTGCFMSRRSGGGPMPAPIVFQMWRTAGLVRLDRRSAQSPGGFGRQAPSAPTRPRSVRSLLGAFARQEDGNRPHAASAPAARLAQDVAVRHDLPPAACAATRWRLSRLTRRRPLARRPPRRRPRRRPRLR